MGYYVAPAIAAYYGYTGATKPTEASDEHTVYDQVPIFLFHNFDGKGRYAIDRGEFRRYLSIIREEGVRVIPLRTLYEMARSGEMVDRPSCVITIDDDFKNIVRIGAPLLREYGFPATLFVYAAEIQPRPEAGMSYEDLDRIRHEGFEIQNHSFSHSMFHKPRRNESARAYRARLAREIVYSKEALEQNLPGLRIYAFAYPMGYYSEDLAKSLFDAGYELLLTTDSHMVNLSAPFTGTFDRYTVQRLENGDYQKSFRRLLNRAKTPYNGNYR
jgi:peptidoglycan/xylan/chitin deacetylase (PgdA/CDA1 family)